MLELMDILIYLPLGALAGLLAGLLGVGGGLVIVPALIWVFHGHGFDGQVLVHLAVGTSLATIVVTSISSVRAHHRHGAVHWPLVWALTPGIVVGAWLGAVLADWLPSLTLQRVFACLAILVGLQMVLSVKAEAHGGGCLGVSGCSARVASSAPSPPSSASAVAP
ncbi:MAG: sulfite exporter TauE/SafE family protein [Candidatus Sedimenticola endophacoides]